MNRRTLLKAAGAAMVPGISLAQNKPNGFQAVAFDGRTYLVNPGTDPSLALPASATTGLIAYSCQTAPATVFSPYAVVLGIFNPAATGPGPGLWVLHSTTSSGSMLVELIVTFPTQDALGLGGWATIPSEGNWHKCVVGFDAAEPSIQVVLDGRSLPVTYASATNNQGVIRFGEPILIGAQGDAPPAFAFKGGLADIWGYFGQAIEATDPQVIAGFWDTRHQEAARISSDGQSAIRGIRPNFFLSGDVGKFLQNGPSSIGRYSWTGANSQSPFTVGAGALRQPDSDPWNYAVVGTSAAAATARVIGARRRLGMPLR